MSDKTQWVIEGRSQLGTLFVLSLFACAGSQWCGLPPCFDTLVRKIWISDLPNLWLRRIIWAKDAFKLATWRIVPISSSSETPEEQWRPNLPVVRPRLHHKERAVYHPSITPWLRNWKGLRFSTCDFGHAKLVREESGTARIAQSHRGPAAQRFKEGFFLMGFGSFSQQRAKVLAPTS